MTVSDSEADKLGDTNKLSVGEIYTHIQRISLISNSYNQIYTLTVLKHAVAQLSLCFNQIFYLNHKPDNTIQTLLSQADILYTDILA